MFVFVLSLLALFSLFSLYVSTKVTLFFKECYDLSKECSVDHEDGYAMIEVPGEWVTALCMPMELGASWLLKVKSVGMLLQAPFAPEAQRGVRLMSIAAWLAARNCGYKLVLVVPERLWIPDDTFTQAQQRMALIAHEQYHAKCFVERNFMAHEYVEDLIAEEIEAYKIQYSLLGLAPTQDQFLEMAQTSAYLGAGQFLKRRS